MLSIRREQREVMGEPAFVDRTIGRFRRYFMEHVYKLDDDELRLRVRHSIEKARTYGLTFESSITTFVAHMLTINPEFDKQPVIHGVLIDPSIEVENRMTAMLGIVTNDDWEEAAELGDPAAYWARLHETLAKEDES